MNGKKGAFVSVFARVHNWICFIHAGFRDEGRRLSLLAVWFGGDGGGVWGGLQYLPFPPPELSHYSTCVAENSRRGERLIKLTQA